MLNATSALGLDVSGFYSDTYGKLGTTVFASYNIGSPYDPADIGLTAIPEYNRYTINPRVFYEFKEDTKLDIGVNTTVEERTGGNIDYLEGEEVEDPFFERNNTARTTLQSGFEHSWNENNRFNLKNSFSFFDREIETGDYIFAGKQFASYNEASVVFGTDKMEWVGGLNLWVDRFEQEVLNDAPVVV